MRLATKLGVYSIVQRQAPDDGEAAVYQVSALAREDLENLLRVTALRQDISTRSDTNERYSILATQQEIFEIMSLLAESIDYETFEPHIFPGKGQPADDQAAGSDGLDARANFVFGSRSNP